MSLPWFKLYTDVADHPKTMEVASLMLGDIDRAVGVIVRFWCWIAKFRPDGRLRPGDDSFFPSWNALETAGFVEELEDGSYVAHDWAEVQGAHAAKVERDRQRMRELRSKRDSSRDSRATMRESRDYSRDRSRVRVEESRVEDTTSALPSESPPALELLPQEPQAPDQRRQLSDALVATYAEVRRQPYGFDGAKDARAVARLLKIGLPHAEILARWRAALNRHFRPAVGIADFAARLNDFPANGSSGDVKRGTVAAESMDWSGEKTGTGGWDD